MTLTPIAAALLLTHLSPSPEDWPHWRGPERSGVSPETGWSSRGADEPVWKVDVGRGYSSPSVSGGRVFTRGFFEEEDKKGRDVTVCLDAETGEELWSHSSPAELLDNMHGGGTLTTPAVAGDAVYVLGRMGNLWSLASTDGAVQWEKDLGEELGSEKGYFGLASSPVVLGDAVIVNVGKTAAFDRRSGERLWTTRDYGYSYGTPAPFELDGRGLLAVFNGAGLAVLDQATGSEVALHEWTSGYNVNCATPIVIDNRIFISTGYDDMGCALLELGEEGLSVAWTSRAMSNLMNGCVLVDELLFGFDKAVLKCLDLDGKERWAHRGLGRGTVIASDGRLIVLSEEGELAVGRAGPDGFEPTHEANVLDEGPCWTTPVLADGRIFCRSSSGELVCLDHRGSTPEPEAR